MEKTNGTYGKPRPNVIPRSKIYKSVDKVKKKHTTFTRTCDIGSFHFILYFTSGDNYTTEEIECCNGKRRCTNCGRKIMKQIWFYPEKETIDRGIIASPYPYCRPECALQGLKDLRNNDMESLFVLVYGPVLPAGDRRVLTLPGGPTIEEYHERIDKKVIVNIIRPTIHDHFADVYVSSTMMRGRQLRDETIHFIDDKSAEKKVSMGQIRHRENNADMDIVELEEPDLYNTKLSKMFSIDKSSYVTADSSEQMKTNRHMMKSKDT